ncbi:MAG: Kae1-associated serine/threonine protein kinase [Candidatus Aenigmatarchaeota archaeon]|nr:MAG: Kae1-associated serine/threonine protein kinase [Candidatus Aenigmarchaeota archaeon]
MSKEIIQRGAEAVLYREGKTLVKDRVKKGYRLPLLDEDIRKRRTRLEAALLEKAKRAGISVPYAEIAEKHVINMDYIDGERVKDVLNGMKASEQKKAAEKIGAAIAKLHSADLVHGDLTTSNMILKGDELYLIDFGLGKVSHKVEDKATDLFLLYEALISTHIEISQAVWKTIINIYMQQYSTASEVMTRFEKIGQRRRYK